MTCARMRRGGGPEGITSVPTVIVNDRYVIQGGQAPAAFEKAIRRIVAEG